MNKVLQLFFGPFLCRNKDVLFPFLQLHFDILCSSYSFVIHFVFTPSSCPVHGLFTSYLFLLPIQILFLYFQFLTFRMLFKSSNQSRGIVNKYLGMAHVLIYQKVTRKRNQVNGHEKERHERKELKGNERKPKQNPIHNSPSQMKIPYITN